MNQAGSQAPSEEGLSIEPEAAARLDEQGIGLLSQLGPVDESLIRLTQAEKPEASGFFRARYFTDAAYLQPKDEIPARSVSMMVGPAGQELSRTFPMAGANIPLGLAGATHAEFIALCRTLQQQPQIRDALSLGCVVEAAFDWLRDRQYGATNQSMTGYVLQQAGERVASWEVGFPITRTLVATTEPIILGRVKLCRFSPEEHREWARVWQQQGRLDAGAQRKLEQLQNDTAVAITTVVAEPLRAVERGLALVEEALGVLRFYSFANLSPMEVCYCTISGQEFIASPRHLLMREGVLHHVGETQADLKSRPPWRLDDRELEKMRAVGFDTLARLLGQDMRTQFQDALLRSLDIYSRSCLSSDVQDKLVFIIVALESLFLKSTLEGSIRKNVSERLAFLLGETLDARQHIISCYSRAYQIRSKALHHGVRPQDLEAVREFMDVAWHVFLRLIQNVDRFAQQQDMIQWLDDMKFA